MELKEKIINVIDKNSNALSPTDVRTASTLVYRERAKWVGKNKIMLIKTKKDWINLKNSIIEEEQRICYICGRFIPIKEHATVDHINPKSRRGKDERSNLHCCCKRCNDDKSNMTFIEYCQHTKEDKTGKYDYLNKKS